MAGCTIAVMPQDHMIYIVDDDRRLDPKTAQENPWAVFDDYIDRVVIQCVNALTPTWENRLAAYDVYIWVQCYSMEQSLRID